MICYICNNNCYQENFFPRKFLQIVLILIDLSTYLNSNLRKLTLRLISSRFTRIFPSQLYFSDIALFKDHDISEMKVTLAREEGMLQTMRCTIFPLLSILHRQRRTSCSFSKVPIPAKMGECSRNNHNTWISYKIYLRA